MNVACFKMVFISVVEAGNLPSLEALEELPLEAWGAGEAIPCQGELPYQAVLPFLAVLPFHDVVLPFLLVVLPCSLEDLPYPQVDLPYSLVGQAVSYRQGDPNPWARPLGDPSPFQADPRIQAVVASLGIWEALEGQACPKALAILAWEALALPLNLEEEGALGGSLEEQEGEEACLQVEEQGVGA